MNMYTKLSGKGQIVLPKAMRELKDWPAGTDLEVVDAGTGVLLRPRGPRKTLTVEEAVARLRKIYVHQGPPVPLDQLSWNAEGDDQP
ncbi:AbrB/MazE/SpoVT family DNA-binding domain-containing protein [Sphingomonas sp.]|jgi:AbrB family looped-hinge helix DNA binding protein|uniref:AbrB/MazE/SpoVT family DNA-binding domain-containing protein n=1 Tax=Sphingomonas sp. TaxID=28214 RepID=UPI002D7E6E25|nr:AbrB/MazE/SpoVT family DNA-binding domain-containing protein [Sphingomonas sp.]HEU0043299.1 AbrB/MazE/SpoVT family DNA-binding domain-containing protein [Sphingomonas sp.]